MVPIRVSAVRQVAVLLVGCCALSGCSYEVAVAVVGEPGPHISVFVPLCDGAQVTSISVTKSPWPSPAFTAESTLQVWQLDALGGFGEERWFVVGAAEPGRVAAVEEAVVASMDPQEEVLYDIDVEVTRGDHRHGSFSLNDLNGLRALPLDGSADSGLGGQISADAESLAEFESDQCDVGSAALADIIPIGILRAIPLILGIVVLIGVLVTVGTLLLLLPLRWVRRRSAQ